jgi:protease-4
MDNLWRLSVLLLGVVLAPLHAGCITINLPPGPAALQEYKISGEGKDKVLLVDLSGVISSESREGFYTYPSLPATIKEELLKAAKDERVKAMVVRINSPGGTVTASDIIYHELKSFKRARNIPLWRPSWTSAPPEATISRRRPTQ